MMHTSGQNSQGSSSISMTNRPELISIWSDGRQPLEASRVRGGMSDDVGCRLRRQVALEREVVGVDERNALAELVRAHADLERLTEEIADVRERRRRAARRLIDSGHGTTWIAGQLGVTKQAVDGFLKYKERKNAHS
jgi:hypothetical protein